MELIERIMCGNGKPIFHFHEKTAPCQKAPRC
jgi:hypothetical protein